MSLKIVRLLIASAALLCSALAWSSTDAVVRAAGHCNCVGASQVQIGGSQVGSDTFKWNTFAASTVDCAANVCQGLASFTSTQLCGVHGAQTYSHQWWWAFDNPVGSGNLQQSGNCP